MSVPFYRTHGTCASAGQSPEWRKHNAMVVLNMKQTCAQGSYLCALSVLNSLHVLFFSFVMRSVDSHQCKFCCDNWKGNISKTRHSEEYFFAEMYNMSPFWKNASRWPAGPLTWRWPMPRTVGLLRWTKPHKHPAQYCTVLTVKTGCFTQVTVQTKFSLK